MEANRRVESERKTFWEVQIRRVTDPPELQAETESLAHHFAEQENMRSRRVHSRLVFT